MQSNPYESPIVRAEVAEPPKSPEVERLKRHLGIHDAILVILILAVISLAVLLFGVMYEQVYPVSTPSR